MYKILIADDEAKIRQLIRKYGEFDGHKIIEAENGIEAIEKVSAESPDIVVLDIMMPEIDGFTATKEIRKKSDIPIIMLSARGEEYDKIHGFELGIDDYVVKPFSPRELMMRISAVTLLRAAVQALSAIRFPSYQPPPTKLTISTLSPPLSTVLSYCVFGKISPFSSTATRFTS